MFIYLLFFVGPKKVINLKMLSWKIFVDDYSKKTIVNKMIKIIKKDFIFSVITKPNLSFEKLITKVSLDVCEKFKIKSQVGVNLHASILLYFSLDQVVQKNTLQNHVDVKKW